MGTFSTMHGMMVVALVLHSCTNWLHSTLAVGRPPAVNTQATKHISMCLLADDIYTATTHAYLDAPADAHGESSLPVAASC
jgi:hypothetical protein